MSEMQSGIVNHCPKCKGRDTMTITFKNSSWVKVCYTKDCDYEEKIPTDAWREEL